LQPFTTLTAIAAPIDDDNVDTDQIIPARFLLKPRAVDYGELLFRDLRFGAAAQPTFALNLKSYRAAQIIVGSRNFGCGSSREHAAYALVDYGIRAVIAPSFGDIFRINCIKNGVLPAQVSEADAATLRAALHRQPGTVLTVDLVHQTIAGAGNELFSFVLNAHARDQLLSGEDDVARTLAHGDAIAAFEAAHRETMPWADPS